MLIKEHFDYVVIGSGPGGSLIVSRLLLKGKNVLLLEAGDKGNKDLNISEGIFSNYWNGGFVPMIGPTIMPFGQAKVYGGGSHINGALLWPTPKKILSQWKEKLPSSVFASPTWEVSENSICKEFGVSNTHNSYLMGNIASKIIKDTALRLNYHSVSVPRAVKDCENSNRCASGCPNNRKQTTTKILLNNIDSKRISLNSLVSSVKKNIYDKNWIINYTNKTNKKAVSADKVILSAGATESANILTNSGLSVNAGNYFEFHINLKIVSKFNTNVDPLNGTILTEQIQEFMNDDMLFMSSNFTEAYLAMTLLHLPKNLYQNFLNNLINCLIHTVMIRPNVKARVKKFAGQTYILWSWDLYSFELVKKGLFTLSNILFQAGAIELILPIKNKNPSATNISTVYEKIKSINPMDLIAASVHGMSSCRMGDSSINSVVDLDAKVWGHDNIYVVDSSILPSNTGESPQGTILTTADEIFQRWNF